MLGRMGDLRLQSACSAESDSLPLFESGKL